jgi:hypothetical protein
MARSALMGFHQATQTGAEATNRTAASRWMKPVRPHPGTHARPPTYARLRAGAGLPADFVVRFAGDLFAGAVALGLTLRT